MKSEQLKCEHCRPIKKKPEYLPFEQLLKEFKKFNPPYQRINNYEPQEKASHPRNHQDKNSSSIR